MNRKKILVLVFIELILLFLLIIPYISSRNDLDYSSDFFKIEEDKDGELVISSDVISLKKGIYQMAFDYTYNTENIPDLEVTYKEKEREGIINPNSSYVHGLVVDNFKLRNKSQKVLTRVYVNEDSCDFQIVIKGKYEENMLSENHTSSDNIITVSRTQLQYLKVHSLVMHFLKYAFILFIIDVIVVIFCSPKWKSKSKEAKKLYFFVTVMTIISSIPLFVDSLPIGHDLGFHLLRIKSIADGISARNLPVKIQWSWMNSAGYATGVCYGDIFLYIPAFIYLVGFPLRTAYKVYVILINLVTVLVSFYCSRKVSNDDRIAMFTSCIYSLSIYRFVDLYTRAAVGEYTAITFLPLILLGLYSWIGKKKHAVLFLVLGFTGVIWSHILSGVMMVELCIVISLICIKKVFKLDRIIELLKAVGVTLLVNAGFIIPFLDYYKNEDLCIKYSNYSIGGEGLFLSQFFQTRFNTTAPSFNYINGISDDIPASCGLAILLILALGIYSAFSSKIDKKNLVIIFLTFFYGFLSTIYMPYDLIEAKLPHVYKVLFSSLQFPWRFLAVMVLLGSTLFLMMQMNDGMFGIAKRNSVVYIIAIVSIVQAMIFLSDYSVQSGRQTFVDASDIDTFYMVGEYLPSGTDIRNLREHKVINYSPDKVRTSSEEQNKSKFCFYAENFTTENVFVEAPVIAYHGMTAVDQDGNKMDYDTGDGHLLRIIIPAEYTGEVKVYFSEPFCWRFAEGVSLITVIGAVFILFKRYYRKSNG